MGYHDYINLMNGEGQLLEKKLSKLKCPLGASMTDKFNKWIDKNSSILELSDYTRDWIKRYCVAVLENADNSREDRDKTIRLLRLNNISDDYVSDMDLFKTDSTEIQTIVASAKDYLYQNVVPTEIVEEYREHFDSRTNWFVRRISFVLSSFYIENLILRYGIEKTLTQLQFDIKADCNKYKESNYDFLTFFSKLKYKEILDSVQTVGTFLFEPSEVIIDRFAEYDPWLHFEERFALYVTSLHDEISNLDDGAHDQAERVHDFFMKNGFDDQGIQNEFAENTWKKACQSYIDDRLHIWAKGAIRLEQLINDKGTEYLINETAKKIAVSNKLEEMYLGMVCELNKYRL